MLAVSYHNNYNVAKLHMSVVIAVLVRKINFNIYPILFLNILDNISLTPVKSVIVILVLGV